MIHGIMIGDGLFETPVAGGAATVFGRAGVFAPYAAGVDGAGLPRKTLLQGDGMAPAITEIIEIIGRQVFRLECEVSEILQIHPVRFF